MKKLFIFPLLLIITAMLFFVPPAISQTTGDTGTTTGMTDEADDDDGQDYGWIGLLGLAGLLGLRRKRDHDNRTHVNR